MYSDIAVVPLKTYSALSIPDCHPTASVAYPQGMDIFSLHHNIVEDYRDYIRSFVNISDVRISQQVKGELERGRLWPEPLLHFNPSFEEAGTISALVKKDHGLHQSLASAFKGYSIFRHQLDAMRLGVGGSDFVVTSGTGSGKSLTYIGTILDRKSVV